MEETCEMVVVIWIHFIWVVFLISYATFSPIPYSIICARAEDFVVGLESILAHGPQIYQQTFHFPYETLQTTKKTYSDSAWDFREEVANIIIITNFLGR